MLRIDIHTHILPKIIPDYKNRFGYGGFIRLNHTDSCCAKMMRDDGTFFRDVMPNTWDPEIRLSECQKTQVDVQVLSTVPVMFHYWAKAEDAAVTAEFLNNHIGEIVSTNPQRFVGLGTVPLQDRKLSIRELERAKKIGLRGVQIGTHVNGTNLGEEAFFDFYAACSDLDIPIFVHPWDMLAPDRMKNYWLSWLVGMPTETALAICSMMFSGVFIKFPELRVAFAHGGGSFPGTIGRIEHGYQVRPDLCATDCRVSPRQQMRNFYVDALVHDEGALRNLIKLVGPEKIACGSDYPFPLGEHQPGSLIDSLTELSPGDRERMLSGTALEWLGLPKEQFFRENNP